MERMMDNETFDEVLNSFKEVDSIVKRLKTRTAELEEENKKLKEDLDKREYYDKVNGLDKFVEMSNEMAELEKENKKLKEELSKYKKQYEHSMGFMEEDTLQELKDIGEI